jgi:hypothetical protein
LVTVKAPHTPVSSENPFKSNRFVTALRVKKP